jgi:Ser/Thr protein kinase RdoA (MazF antagonist)
LGRVHNLGKTELFTHRRTVDIASYGIASRDFLLASDMIPSALRIAYKTLSSDLLERVTELFSLIEYQPVRLHGDCHGGNILWRDYSAYFVDFDDARNGLGACRT